MLGSDREVQNVSAMGRPLSLRWLSSLPSARRSRASGRLSQPDGEPDRGRGELGSDARVPAEGIPQLLGRESRSRGSYEALQNEGMEAGIKPDETFPSFLLVADPLQVSATG